MNKMVTRAQAQRKIAETTDPEVIQSFAKHPNKHIRAYVEHKLASLARREEEEQKAAELFLKRSAAAKKGAETRKAKKAAQKTETV